MSELTCGYFPIMSFEVADMDTTITSGNCAYFPVNNAYCSAMLYRDVPRCTVHDYVR